MHTAGLDACEVEQRVDQLQQPQLVAVQQLEVLATEHPLIGGQGLLGGPEHQRERRAKLMAHVREEGGLRPIELLERLGPRPRVAERACLGDGRRNLVTDQAQESRVALVERTGRADTEDREPIGPRLAARRERQHHGTLGGERQRTGWHRPEAGDVVHVHATATSGALGQRPDAAVASCASSIEMLARRRRSPAIPVLAATRAWWPSPSSQVQHREGHIGVAPENPRGRLARLARRAGVAARRRQVAQRAQLAMALHLLGGFLDGHEHAAHAVVVIRDRAVPRT